MSSSPCLRLFAGLLLLGTTGAAGAAPVTVPGVSHTVSEQASRDHVVGRAGGRVDGAAAREFEIVAGNTDETFAIDPRTGEIRVARAERLDYETRPRFDLKVRWKRAETVDETRRKFAADLLASNVDPAAVMELFTVSADQRVTIEVLDVNEPPVIPAQSLTLVADAADPAAAAAVGRLRAIDPDQGDALHFEVIAGDPEGWLIVDAKTGQIGLAPERSIPAGQQVVPLTVRVTDRAGAGDAATVSVRLVGIPAPQIAQAPPPADVIETDPAPPAEVAATEPAEPVTPAPVARPETAAVGELPVAAPAPSMSRPTSRPALWFFAAGALLGAGVMTVVFRYAGRKGRVAITTLDAAPRNPLAQPRPQPLSVTTPEQLRAFRASLAPRAVAAPLLVPTQPVVHRREDEPPASSADQFEVRDEKRGESIPEVGPLSVDSMHWSPEDVVEPAGEVEPAHPTGLPEWQDEPLRADVPSPLEEGQPEEFASPLAFSDWSAIDEPSETVPGEVEVPEEPLTIGPAHPWADSSVMGEPLPRTAPDEADQSAPVDFPADDVYDVAAVCETDEVVHEVQDDFAAHDVAVAPDELPDLPAAADAEAEAAPGDAHEAAAVHEAAEALGEAHSPPGVDPRVAELRQQLIELFGVPADRPAGDHDAPAGELEEAPDPEMMESAIEFHLPKHVAADSARVDELFDSLRFDLQQGSPSAQSAGAETGGRLSATDAFVLTPLTPEVQLARSARAEPAARVNKSAVRQEISSLREVANTYARAIVARQTTEKRARIVWLVSGCCMVPLFSGGTYLLTSMPPGLMRWLGWLLLTGGAVAFSVCLNSFNRLSKLHEDSQYPDEPSSSPQARSMSDTAEFDVPAELVSKGGNSEPVSPVPAAERDAEQPEPEPAEVGAV